MIGVVHIHDEFFNGLTVKSRFSHNLSDSIDTMQPSLDECALLKQNSMYSYANTLLRFTQVVGEPNTLSIQRGAVGLLVASVSIIEGYFQLVQEVFLYHYNPGHLYPVCFRNT